MTRKVKIEAVVSDVLIQDILVQVMETSAVTYWATLGSRIADQSAVLIEQEPSQGDEPKELALDADSIVAGIQAALEPGFQVRDDIRAAILRAVYMGDDGGGEIDVEVADVIVQAAMFAEIVYS